MDIGVLKLKGFNRYIYILMGIQLLLLLGITVILLSAIAPGIDIFTIVSGVLILMLVLPLLALLYTSSSDSIVKKLLLGLLLNEVLLSASGIIWYILSDRLGTSWSIPVAKILMVLCYLPLLCILYGLSKGEHKKIGLYPKALLAIINMVCTILIIYYTVTRFNTGNEFDIGIYFLAVLGDILTLAMASMLVIVYTPVLVRYLLAVIFIYVLFSIVGDSLNLANALQMGVSNSPGITRLFYNGMLVFLTVALLVYSIFKNVNALAVDEVNKRLDDTRQALNDLVMQMPDAACYCDTSGIAMLVNDPFLRLFNTRRENTIGKFRLFDHEGLLRGDIGQKFPLLRRGETIQANAVPVVFPGDRRVYLSVKLFPTFSRDREISGFVAFVEDVTARVQAEEELKRAKGLVELYIDLMSHDINNMNQVGMGYLEIALDTLAVQDDKKFLLTKPLEVLGNSSRLIENVKKLRRASEGDAYLRPVDLGKVLKGVISEHGQAPGRDVSIEYDVAENALVNANELLKDVFINLVSNSIKHSSGAVSIMVKQEPRVSGDKRYYRVTVEDNGPGVPDELKPVIFDRLLRGRSRNGSGGLGLYLVKALIDSYGGTIAVEDRVPGDRSQGARFIVLLPEAPSG